MRFDMLLRDEDTYIAGFYQMESTRQGKERMFPEGSDMPTDNKFLV